LDLAEKQQTLVFCHKNETVKDVISKIGEHRISSVPVVDKDNHFVGMVDMLDLLTFAGGKMGIKCPDPPTSQRAGKEFLNKTIEDLMNVSGRNQIHWLPANAPLQDLLHLLSKPDVHRVLLRNEKGEFCSFVTQSQMLQYLNDNKQQFDSIMNQTVKDLWNIRLKHVETIHCDKFVIDALVQLIQNRISGIAVVNSQGQIVGHISASDLKRMDVQNPYQLCYDIYESIKNFMNLSEDKQKPQNAKLPHFEPVIVKEDARVGELVSLMVAKKIHRVFVVDDGGKPVGEISLCDIIQKFASPTSQ
jgi:CBS domain-containing protein